MYLKLTWERIWGVIFLPQKTWLQMKKESGYALETIVFLFLSCLLLGVSSYLSKYDESWAPETFIFFISLLVFSVIIRTFNPQMRKINWEGSINLVAFSVHPSLWIYAASMFVGYRIYLLPIALIYSTFLFGIGLKFMLAMSWKDSIIYSLAGVLTLIVCIYWGRVFFSI